ncbi:MAG: DUF188 domain-containing protein [Bacilli bacterium]|nr:DUF188 domain-containing protein [Bacilli bacterium]MDD4733731.1 DUF188 domain-containing protein [Bacilli bacterium]
MRILVDADACPSIDLITELARKKRIELILYADTTHIISNDYAKVITLSKGFQSVDTFITNDIREKDILITQDFGLAVIALSKKANAIHPKGLIYTNDNINGLLFERHLNFKNRKTKIRTKNIKKRTKLDDLNLIKNLKKLLK